MADVLSKMERRAVFLFLCLATVAAFYGDSSSVVSLTGKDFKKRIEKGGYWLVEFYAPWCGHCQKLKPDYEKTAKGLEGVIHVAAVDCEEHKSVAGEYGVKGFPTIKMFYTTSKGSITNVDYSGGRTAAEMITWVMDQTKKLALKRVGVKGEKKQKSSSSGGGGGGGGSGFYGSGSDVVNLGSSNFEKEVNDSDDLWMVEFYAPWCGHCKNLKPDWEKAATELKGKVKVGAVDCTADEGFCGQFGVQGFPSLKFFGTNKNSPEDYNAGRDSAAIVAFALEKWSKMAPPPEVKELTESFVFEKHCSGLDDAQPQQLCLIAFLPNILDGQAKGRNAYIEILRKVAAHYKGMSFGYLWAEGGKQKKLEGSFGVGGFGYPAVVLYSPKKNAYSILKAGLDYKHCVEFVDSLRHGFEKVTLLDGGLAEVVMTTPWDGLDALEEVADEFDLDDIMNEEL